MQLVQVTAADAQFEHGELQSSHILLIVFPNFPEGHVLTQFEPDKKKVSEQAVHKDPEPEHLLHGFIQFLHCQELL